MGPRTIAYELLDNLFFPALGTNEWPRGQQSQDFVGPHGPMTWDTNNGILVVYDGQGLPWIRSTKFLTPEWVEQFTGRHGLRRGAYVPHSNDGGIFKRKVFEQTGVEV